MAAAMAAGTVVVMAEAVTEGAAATEAAVVTDAARSDSGRCSSARLA
jgi:hypothetical protein